jgi:hypothetical protein
VKIYFVDFWPNFKQEDNYFYHLLKTGYDVEIDPVDPDILFFSVDYAKKHERDKYKNHRCKKIFFTGENVRANYDESSIESEMYSIGKCNFAFTFDFSDDPRHYRLPLWVLYIDWFNKQSYGNPHFLLPVNQIYDNAAISTEKKEFCAFIFSNPVPLRVEMFNKMSNYKQVHGYGKPFNNWSHGELNKYNILANYKFSICFENSVSPVGGYYTEKLFHAKTAGTVPIYWSDEKCKNDFNPKSFINLNDFDSIEALIDYVKEVDQSQQLYESYRNEPLFLDKQINKEFLPESVLSFFKEVIL